MQPPALGPRVLLRQLREVMAEPENAQDRLDKITKLIAANVVAEVCSIYVMRPGRELELFASKGLKQEAVHNTRMTINEGLVGTIAANSQMLNLPNAQDHPAFKFMPETGEEVFHSFLGVPILKNGNPIGVLVVQNETRRHYSSEEEEAVQTTAMVLAEIISSGELDEVTNPTEADVAHLRSHFLNGEAVVPGIAIGHVVLHEPRVVISNFVASDVGQEVERLKTAIEQLRGQIDQMITTSNTPRSGEYSEVLETYRMFANDRGWVERIVSAVETGLTAEAAVERVQNENRARLSKAADAYLRERMTDLDDLANRLLRGLTGTAQTAAQDELPDAAVLVARTMGPAELLDYDRSKIFGLVLEDAGSNSHVAIVARALGIPVVGELDGIVELVDTGDDIIIDGSNGEAHVRPNGEVVEAYGEKVQFYARKQAKFAQLRDEPAVTRDGMAISLNINAGLMVDLPHLSDSGADGIGLFRTELQFMIARSFPRQDAQMQHYKTVLEAAGDKPVVFRSLDIGSDKNLPYLSGFKEDNPALGWRGLRMSLSRPAFLQLQLRALLQAAAGKPLNLMFPFVASLAEFVQAKEVVEKEIRRLTQAGHPIPVAIKLGIMIEVPSIVWQLDDVLPEVDFVSVGSNDLAQYLFASDRAESALVQRYDLLSPVFLRVLAEIAAKCKKHTVPVTLCGEMAGSPLEAMALIAVGYRSISMAPAAIGPVKAMIIGLDQARLAKFVEPLIDTPSSSIRPQLHAFARGNNIPV
ncbi:Phosphocarrier protein kinase/phosphorylase, nitrogen regulation associated [hydrothermal vent metagenome]|uniref:phosphoenolpyruvate--protein phosphotransferase n=1 Tax=hydrothermal vent metagenome TaxID=652676 RepID=A0A3B0S8W0_9ZZZZ